MYFSVCMNGKNVMFWCLFTVKRCVDVLKSVLQRDCARQALVKWYAIRNAPGAQDISPKQEWSLFLTAMLSECTHLFLTLPSFM